jgi:hypothetical protein
MSLNKFNQTMAYLTSPEPKKISFQLRESHGQMFQPDEVEVERLNFAEAGFVSGDEFKKLYADFVGSDTEFANLLNEQGFKTRAGQSYNRKSVEKKRKDLGITSNNPTQRGIGWTKQQIIDQAKKFNIDPKKYSLEDLRQLVNNKRGQAARKEQYATDPEYREKRQQQKREVMERVKADPQRYELYKLKAKERRGPALYQDLVPTEKTAKGMFWRDLIINGLKEQRYGKNEYHIQFANPKQKSPKNLQDTLSVKLIDTNFPKKPITFGNFLKHLDKNQEFYGIDSKTALKEYDKKRFLQTKPQLRDELNQVIYGSSYDPTNVSNRRFFSPMHVHHVAGRKGNAFNVQFSVAPENKLEGAERRKLDNIFSRSTDEATKAKAVKNYVDNVAETLETRLPKEMAEYLGGQEIRGRRESFTEMTKRVAPELLETLDAGTIAQMNELGFMGMTDSAAQEFSNVLRKVKPGATAVAKVALTEIGLGAPFALLDYNEGYSTEDILTNIATLGVGTAFKDEAQKRNYIKDVHPNLIEAYDSLKAKEKFVPSLAYSVGRGAGSYDPNAYVPPEVTAVEKVANVFGQKFEEGLGLDRQKTALEREQAAATRELPVISDVDIPEQPFIKQEELPEATGFDFLGKTIAGEPRMEFDKGGSPKKEKIDIPRRRVVQGIGMGLASIPFLGPLGRLLRGSSKTATKAVAKTAAKAAIRDNSFERFMMASKKLFDEGTPSYTKEGEIRIVHPDKNITYVEDVQSGHKHIEFETDKGTTGYIEYRPGESYIDEATGKGGVSNPEVIDYEEVYRASGPDDYVKDIEEGMSDDILTSFDNFIGFKSKKE